MEPRISLVTLAVSDLEAASAFYERLGWRPSFANEEVTFCQLGGVVLGLWQRHRMAAHLGMQERELGPGGMELAHNVRRREDVDAVLEEARSAGATVLVPAADASWGGRSCHFADPDGYRWEVAWNPAWSITADGQTLVDPHRQAPAPGPTAVAEERPPARWTRPRWLDTGLAALGGLLAWPLAVAAWFGPHWTLLLPPVAAVALWSITTAWPVLGPPAPRLRSFAGGFMLVFVVLGLGIAVVEMGGGRG